MAEDDWEGWKMLTDALGHRVQLVGDDLFVTNVRPHQEGHRTARAQTAVLIKLNQIGTLTETLDAIQRSPTARATPPSSPTAPAKRRTPPSPICRRRLNAGQIKTGAPSRTDRVAKYNQLLRIEEELFDVPRSTPARAAFFSIR